MIRGMRRLILIALMILVLPQVVSAALSNVGHIHYSKVFVEPEMGFEQRIEALHETSGWLRKALSLSANQRQRKQLQVLDSLLLQIEHQVGQDSQLRWLSARDLSLEAGPGLILRGFDVPVGALLLEGEFPIRLCWEGANCQVETTRNLVSNGGFEQGVGFVDGPIMPPGYSTVYYYRRSIGRYELTVAEPHGGVATTIMCLLNPDESRWPGLKTSRVPIRSDRLYLIAGWMSQSTDQRGQIRIVSYRSEQDRRDDFLERYPIPATQHLGNWSFHAELRRFEDGETNYVQLWLTNLRGTGTVCFDNILFVELPAVRPQ